MASSDSGGVKVVFLEGRLSRERERLIGMTDEERAWRARFLKSQNLAPEEPLMLKEYYRQYYNPIRRFYMAPLNQVERLLVPLVGSTTAYAMRHLTSRIVMSVIGIYCGWYYLKYNHSTWEKHAGWRIARPHKLSFPGSKDYKGIEKPKHFATSGFENSPI